MYTYTFSKNYRECTVNARTLYHAMIMAARHHENKDGVPIKIVGGGRQYSYGEILNYCQTNRLFERI